MCSVKDEAYMLSDIFGTIALITSIIGLMPQVIKAHKTKSTKDVSMLMLINYFVNSLAWVVYGFYIDSLYVILSDALCVIISGIAISQKVTYEKHDNFIKALAS